MARQTTWLAPEPKQAAELLDIAGDSTGSHININGGFAENSSEDLVMKEPLKVKLRYRIAVFIAASITLSWFFEGTRQIANGVSFTSIGLLVLGTLATLGLLGVYSYWIYIEEKSKGNLKKRIELFERIYASSKYCDGQDQSDTSISARENRGD